MGYSMRYLLGQQARGRPLPAGEPEDHLFRALENLSSTEASEAFLMGASAGARDGRGRTAPEVVLDSAMRGPLVGRAIQCLNELGRHGGRLNGHPQTVRALLVRAAEPLDRPSTSQVPWFEAWWRLVPEPRVWSCNGRPGDPSPVASWQAKAGDALARRLLALVPRPGGPRP